MKPQKYKGHTFLSYDIEPIEILRSYSEQRLSLSDIVDLVKAKGIQNPELDKIEIYFDDNYGDTIDGGELCIHYNKSLSQRDIELKFEEWKCGIDLRDAEKKKIAKTKKEQKEILQKLTPEERKTLGYS